MGFEDPQIIYDVKVKIKGFLASNSLKQNYHLDMDKKKSVNALEIFNKL